MEAVPEKEVIVKTNVFSEPWKNSDLILDIRGTKFHVHRSTLSLQSPVFEAMLNGSFKEAKQEKIDLDEDPDEMLDFLRLLYPYKMFDYPITEEKFNVVAMLKLADKYQTQAVMKLCFDDSPINPDNALQILPYASKYDEDAFEACISCAEEFVACKTLKEILPNLDRSQSDKILFGKCQLLENIAKEAQECLIACMERIQDFINANKVHSRSVRCIHSHDVKIDDLKKVRECSACYVAYTKEFCSAVQRRKVTKWPNIGNKLIKVLSDIDDALHGLDSVDMEQLDI